MSKEIIQIRDVPTDDVEVLRSRAAARHQSLSAYLRNLIHLEATRPSMADIVERIAAREPINVTSDEVRRFIDDGRRT